MVVAAITLTALLLFSSIVFDLGMLMLARRQDQAAADAAALAGVMDLDDETALVNTVVQVLNLNLDGAGLTGADLDTCPPEPLPAGWSTYPSARCLAHDVAWSEVRVRIPTRSMTTVFGRLAGITELDHTAFAQARAVHKATILPFIVEPGAGSYECLKTGPNVPDPACRDKSNGSFGDLELTLFGNPSLGTTIDCNGGTAQYVDNVAIGVDHRLSRYSSSGPEVIETVACASTDPHSLRPNAAFPGTGNQPSKLADGLIGDDTFVDGGPSRLRRTSTLATFSSVTFKTSNSPADFDDTPLWDFIPDHLNFSDNVPRSCWRDQFIGPTGGLDTDNDLVMSALPIAVETYLAGFTTSERMVRLVQRCLDHYRGIAWDDAGGFTGVDTAWGMGCIGACSDPIFTVDTESEAHDIVDIQASPRFAHIPQILPSEQIHDPLVHFDQFRAVFLQRLYLGCNANECDAIFDPGVSFDYQSGKKLSSVDGLTAFILPPGSLPNKLGEPDATDRFGATMFAELTR